MLYTVQTNGVDGRTGEYLSPELTMGQLSQLAAGQPLDLGHLEELRARHESAAPRYGVSFGIDADDLAQAGWAVIFASDVDPDIPQKLSPLLGLRKGQAKECYQEFSGCRAPQPNESCRTWLARQGMGPGPVDPKIVPYYVLIVGDPERIPFRFQWELDVNYAVGRIHFDSVEDYGAYARNVVATEGTGPRNTRHAVFFGTRNPDDAATQLSADHLVRPLADALSKGRTDGWKVERIEPERATKSELRGLLERQDPPALLFTASHGMGFPLDDDRLLAHQGALLCQDWPGRLRHRGPIPTEWYFSGDDVPGSARLGGLVAFHFACYGAGSPKWDDFAHRAGARSQIGPYAFVARLPKRLLALPNGGVLAVVGHVERAWGYSFAWPGLGEQLVAFQSTLGALMAGERIGSAMEYFGMRYADLAVGLSNELEDRKFAKTPDDLLLASLWTANNDARNYMILGDPAVRIM